MRNSSTVLKELKNHMCSLNYVMYYNIDTKRLAFFSKSGLNKYFLQQL